MGGNLFLNQYQKKQKIQHTDALEYLLKLIKRDSRKRKDIMAEIK